MSEKEKQNHKEVLEIAFKEWIKRKAILPEFKELIEEL